MSSPLLLWPQTASDYAGRLDILLVALFVFITLLTAPVFILIATFAVRYRRGRRIDRTHAPNRNVWLEVSWAAIPFVLLLGFYVWSINLFASTHRPPADAIEITAIGKQWMWKFQHPTGQREIDDLHIPAGLPIKLMLTSEDVIHSLFLPALRLKQDVVPGRYTSFWFVADKPGIYRLACTQFCGTDHSVMDGQFVVLTEPDYTKWLAATVSGNDPVTQGKALFGSLGCGACHSAAANRRAPDLAGLFGRRVTLADGAIGIADEQYLHDSMMRPHAQRVAGYPPIMPSYQNVIDETQAINLVAYIKSLTPVEARRE